MNGHGEKRSRKEEAAISALLTESGIAAAAMDAVKALRAIVSSEDSPPSTRVSAARTIFDMAYRAVEVDELSERLDRLEMTTEQMKL